MAVFDRDPAQERRQIQEISANVARRLLDVLDRSHYAPSSARAEIEEAVAVITGIQRDVDQIVTGMPSYEALDIAILTHILGGQQHALERLEDLEAKLVGSSHQPAPFDPDRTHAALIATAREIERDALRYGTHHAPAAPQPAYGSAPYPAAPAPRSPMPPQPASGRPQPRTQPPGRTPKAKPRTTWASGLPGMDFGAILAVPRARASLGIVAATGIALAAWTLVPVSPPPEQPGLETLEAPAEPPASAPAPFTKSLANAAAIGGPSLEQPYLVVLTTRRSTEELQQDYRAFKQAYPDLLTGSKARVDRIQGQDHQTYYRLSLIPPQSRDEAKSLCSRLRTAGLSGCWIRQVPVN